MKELHKIIKNIDITLTIKYYLKSLKFYEKCINMRYIDNWFYKNIKNILFIMKFEFWWIK